MNPKIGIVASAHRPQHWMDLYKSIGDNKVDFELVFVGPNPPDFKLPNNFRFIRSLVKPAQCDEIAFRNTTADLVMPIADDCEFITSHPLDKLYDLYKSFNLDKLIVMSRGMHGDKAWPLSFHCFFTNDDSTPVVGLCGLMSKKFYCELGGIDRNFIGIMWDSDIGMRVHAAGGRVVMSDVYINEDMVGKGSSLCTGEFFLHDRTLLENLWMTNGKVNLNRKKPVEPFSDKNILTASQGPRGRWRGCGLLLFEKTEDKLRAIFGSRSIFGRLSRGIRKPSMYLNYVKRISLYMKKKVEK